MDEFSNRLKEITGKKVTGLVVNAQGFWLAFEDEVMLGPLTGEEVVCENPSSQYTVQTSP